MKKLALFAAALALVAGPAHADPVTAVATWISSTFAIGAATAMTIANFAIGLGASLLSQALVKKQSGPKVDVSFDVRLGDDHPLSFVMGDYVTAGKRKYLGSWGQNTRFITEVIEVSALPHPGLAAIWVDDEQGEFVANRRAYISSGAAADNQSTWQEAASVPGGMLDLGRPLTNYADPGDDGSGNRIAVKFVDGTQAAADPLLVYLFGSDPDYPWTADMIGTGKSYVIVTTRYDSETLLNYPTYLFQPEPLPVYDPRLDSTNGGSGPQRWADPATWQPSRNPAVIAYNIVRGIYFGGEWVFGGKNLPAWRLPAAEWIAAANECDAPEALAGGGSEPAYRCGVEIHVDMAAADVLEEIGRAANMKFAEVGGQIKPVVGLPGAAVYSFTDEEIIITEGQSFKPFVPVSETFNAISATYPEPTEKWATKDSPEYIDTDATAADGGRYLPTSISYPAAPYAQQVQRLQRSQLQDYRRFRRHQFYLPPEAYALEPGIDMVSWTSQRNGYLSKQFVVESVSKTPGMNVLVSLREVDPGDYDWSSDFEAPVITTPPVNPRPFVQPINGLIAVGEAILDASSNQRRPAIRVSCNGDEAGVTQIQIEARITGRTEVVIDTQRRFTAPFNWYLLNVLPDTAYEVRARLLSDLTPRSAWSSWLSVTTPDVGVGLEDLSEDVLEKLQELEDWLDSTDQDIADLRDDIAADVEAVNDRVDETRADLATAVDLLEQNALDLLDVAQGYTDTQVQSESAARQGETDALAARIDALTAALTSDDLLQNGDFADAWDYWNRGGTTTIQQKSEASAVHRNMPADQSATLLAGGDSFIDQTTDDFEATEDDQLQYRFSVASASASRQTRVRITWLDASSNAIGSPVDHTHTAPAANVWRVFSGRVEPPLNARSANIEIRLMSTSGNRVFVTNIASTLVNAAIEARVSELEAAQVTLDEALAIFKSEATARFGTNEAAIISEGAARENADNAISDRVDTVEATTGQNEAAISTIQTAITDLDEAIAQTEETVAARFGAAELVRDGVFARGLTWWTGNLAGDSDVVVKNQNNNWFFHNMPADRALRIPNDAPAGVNALASPYAPVSPGDVLDIGYQYARNSTGNRVRLQFSFRRADGVFVTIGGSQNIDTPPEGTGQRYRPLSRTGIVVPAEAVEVQVRFIQLEESTNANQWCFVTNVSARRRQAFDHLVDAEVSTLTQAFSDLDGAMAALTTTVSSNYNSLDGRVTSNANALNQRYTKAETNTAISTAIDSYDTSVTNRLGQKADASVVNAIDTRVTNTETVANSKNRVWRQASAPANPTAGDIWFQSNNKNKASRWNGSTWQSIEDGDIPEIKSDLSAQSTSITQVQSRTDRGTATGLFRVATESTPSGVQARIGLRAEANAGQTQKSAALFLDARSDGTSQVTIAADRFAIAQGNGVNANRFVPFIVDGGVVYIDEARIRDLAIDTAKIGDAAVSTYEYSHMAGSTPFLQGASDISLVTWATVATLTFVKRRNDPVILDFSFEMVGLSGGDPYVRITRNGSSIWATWRLQDWYEGQSYSRFIDSYVDTDTSVGTVTYRLQVSSDRVQPPVGQIRNRFLGCLNVYK